jgi:deoxyribonuclease-1
MLQRSCSSLALSIGVLILLPAVAYTAHSPPYPRRSAAVSFSAALMAQAPGDIHGNKNSKVYRVPGCKGYASMRPASVVPFATEQEAQQAGYRRAKDCQ